MMLSRVPISVVTGFLGSGKTTLIAALLKQPAMRGAAVIVNEIGAVGIDDAILVDGFDRRDVLLFANGCLCCEAGDDLASTVWSLICRESRPSQIVVETSGLAEPGPVVRRLLGDLRLRQTSRLDCVIATVDAVNGLRALADHPTAQRQAAAADRRLVTKIDLADPDSVEALSGLLRTLNPSGGIEMVTHGVIEADRLFGASLYDPQTGRSDPERWLNREGFFGSSHDPRPIHSAAVGTWLYEEARPIHWEAFSVRLGSIIARHGDDILRLKGIVNTAADTRPLAIHGVQRVFHKPVWLRDWSRPPMTSIVLIGNTAADRAAVDIADALQEAAKAAANLNQPRLLDRTGSYSSPTSS